MKYAIYILLAFALFTSCRSSQIVHKPLEVNAPDSLPDPLSANGWVFVRTSIDGGIYVPPKPVGKVKYKNVGNDYSKTKDAGNYTDKSTVKDKSKVREKVKADIVGDGNQQAKEAKGGWVKWACIALIVLVLGYVFGPFVSSLLPKKLDK